MVVIISSVEPFECIHSFIGKKKLKSYFKRILHKWPLPNFSKTIFVAKKVKNQEPFCNKKIITLKTWYNTDQVPKLKLNLKKVSFWGGIPCKIADTVFVFFCLRLKLFEVLADIMNNNAYGYGLVLYFYGTPSLNLMALLVLT